MNSLHVIFPYQVEGIWAFDDTAKGLQREPFVEEANGFLDALTAHIPNAKAGFRLIFSARPFPGFALNFKLQRAEFDGHWYACEQVGGEGWLCPALLKYFDAAPPELYAKAEAIG